MNNPTQDTITKQFIEGVGVTEHEDGTFTAEPIRAMTPAEITERDSLNQANTTSSRRQRVLEFLGRTNGGAKHG